MKVGKEEMIGLLAAVERYLKADHDGEMKELEARVTEIRDGLAGIDGLTAERYMPPIANHDGRGNREAYARRPSDCRVRVWRAAVEDLGLDDAAGRAPDRARTAARDIQAGLGYRYDENARRTRQPPSSIQ